MNPAHQHWPLSQRRDRACRHCHLAISLPNSESQCAGRIRRFINVACAARAGAAQMTLTDWRDLEREVERRLQNEMYETHRSTESVSRALEPGSRV